MAPHLRKRTVGEAVYVKWPGSSMWFPGRVVSNSDFAKDRTYDVQAIDDEAGDILTLRHTDVAVSE